MFLVRNYKSLDKILRASQVNNQRMLSNEVYAFCFLFLLLLFIIYFPTEIFSFGTPRN